MTIRFGSCLVIGFYDASVVLHKEGQQIIHIVTVILWKKHRMLPLCQI